MRIVFNKTYNVQNNYRNKAFNNTNVNVSFQAKPSKEELQALLSKTNNVNEIAKILNESWGRVLNWMKEYGLHTISGENLQKNYNDILDNIESLLLKGLSCKEIAEKYKTNRRNIYEIATLLLGKDGYKKIKEKAKISKSSKQPPKEINNQKKHYTVAENRERRCMEMQHVCDKALALIRDGMSFPKVAEILNVNIGTLRKYIGKEPLKMAKAAALENERNKIISYAQKGCSIEKIKTQMNCSTDRILKIFDKEMPKLRQLIAKNQVNAIFEHLINGWTDENIAKEFGMTIKQLRAFIEANKSNYDG